MNYGKLGIPGNSPPPPPPPTPRLPYAVDDIEREVTDYNQAVLEAEMDGRATAAFFAQVEHLGIEIATELTAQWLNSNVPDEEDEE